MYSVFAAQAWLPPPNTAWFLAVASCCLAPFLARLHAGRLTLAPWLPWVAGFLAWAIGTSVALGPYASLSRSVFFGIFLIWGLVLYFGARQSLLPQNVSGRFHPLLIVFAWAAGLSLARDAGFDITGGLQLLDLGGSWAEGAKNHWTSKFLGHWLVLLGWCVVASAGSRRDARWVSFFVVIVGLCTLSINQSKSAVLAMAISLTVCVLAFYWPKWTRRLLIGGLTAGVLLAPLLAGAAWQTYVGLRDTPAAPVLGGLDLNIRGGIWEFSRQLISEHPIVGWGFGASSRLPGRDITIGDALEIDSSLPVPPPPDHAIFAGGHPHNAALLTWLDLGLIGALLLSGMLLALGRSIAATEKNRRKHAALMGILTVQAVYFALNYPVWEPEILSILWMGAALLSAVLPGSVVSTKKLVRDSVVVLLFLSIGGGLLAQERLARWLTVKSFRQSPVNLEVAAARLSAGDESWALESGATWNARAELVGPGLILGWIYDPVTGKTPDSVLVFVGSQLVAVVWPEQPSTELFAVARPKDVSALTAGFRTPVNRQRIDLEAPVVLVALEPTLGTMVELPSLAETARSRGSNL